MDETMEESGRTQGGYENLRSLTATARQLIDQGKPSAALQAVMTVMKAQGGEQAVFQILQRARELYRNRLRENAAADELASLFAECAIAEAHQPADPNQSSTSPWAQGIRPVLQKNNCAVIDDTSSILGMSGRKQIMLDAFADGSSFICLQCGGLVSTLRKDEHLAYWCGKD